jgi:hypothetical protein
MALGRILTYAALVCFLRRIYRRKWSNAFRLHHRHAFFCHKKSRQTVCGAIPVHKKSTIFDFCAMHKWRLTLVGHSTTMKLLRCTIPNLIAMSPGRPDADRHALYIWAI